MFLLMSIKEFTWAFGTSSSSPEIICLFHSFADSRTMSNSSLTVIPTTLLSITGTVL